MTNAKCVGCGQALESTGTDESQLPWVHAQTGDAFAGMSSMRHHAQVLIDPDEEAARGKQLHDDEVTRNIGTQLRNLTEAHSRAVLGPPVPARYQPSGPMASSRDETLVNQHYRNSVGSPHHAGAGDEADTPGVDLLSPTWYTRQRPVPPIDENPEVYK